MLALGMGLILGGYTVGLWGYCLIKGYDVSFGELLTAPWPPSTGASSSRTGNGGRVGGDGGATAPGAPQAGGGPGTSGPLTGPGTGPTTPPGGGAFQPTQ